MDKKTAICRFLYENHRGKASAVFSREVERRFSVNGRNLRRKISKLRQEGYPICSDESGYYYAETKEELVDTICRLSTFATKVSIARNGMLCSSLEKPK